MKCNVKHPTLKGVKCDGKRGHKEWHGVKDKTDKTVVYTWAKGHGKQRAIGVISYIAV